MRALPADWPSPTAGEQTVPQVYLHVIDSTWPPAQGDLADGWAEVVSWETTRELVGSLLPGQVKGASGFAVMTAQVTIKQSQTGVLAPWRAGAERVPAGGECELIASYDGPTGATAFLLGRFLLDPISGKASEKTLTIDLVENLVKFRKPHNLEPGLGPGNVLTGWDLLAISAQKLGLTVTMPSTPPALLESIHFPGTTTSLSAWQEFVAVNLGAMYLSIDGTELVIKDFNYLSGAGAIVETIVAVDQIADLEWTVDPGEVVDRFELSYIPPAYGDFRLWVAPSKLRLTPDQTVTYEFDPGVAFYYGSSGAYLEASTTSDGSGTFYEVEVEFIPLSSGRVQATVHNQNAATVYVVTGSGGRSSYIELDLDISDDQSKRVLVWGADEAEAVNPLAIEAGHLVQRTADAQTIIDRAVSRVSSPSTVANDIEVIPNLGREIADIAQLEFPDVGLSTKTLTTKIVTSGDANRIRQTIGVTFLPSILDDFDAAWAASAMPSATLDDFDTFWSTHMPGATLDDFDSDPLATP